MSAAIPELVGLRKAYIVNDKRRALARSSGLGRTALVFDDNDVVDLLRTAVEREGGQHAFARHSGVNYAYLNRVLNGKEPPGRSIAKSRVSGFGKCSSSSERTASFGVAKIPLVGRNIRFWNLACAWNPPWWQYFRLR